MKAISRVLEIISAIFFLACGGYVVLNIITRMFDHPLKGVYEMTGLFAIVFATGSFVVCVIEDGIVNVDIIISRFKPKGQLAMVYVGHIVDLAYYIILAYAGWVVGVERLLANELTTTVLFPIGPFRVFWAIGAALLVIVKIYKIIFAKRDFKVRKETESEAVEEKGEEV